MLKSLMGLEPRMILCMEAVADLSKFHPPLEPNVQRSIVAWALGMVLGGPPIASDPAGQALQQEGKEALPRMLRGLIREDPSSGHLLTLLDQLLYWHQVRWPAPRARACALITDLLAATKMPGWHIIDQDEYGHLVAKLSVSLADPEAEVREKAREVIGQLLRLQQKEQGRSKKTISWEEDPERPWMESYAHLTAAAEVRRPVCGAGQAVLGKASPLGPGPRGPFLIPREGHRRALLGESSGSGVQRDWESPLPFGMPQLWSMP
ncbi:uncharacterized protein LOC143824229 [Paroedura picta]|uniref:uncharacterized protein LOC143824229 n=1 Tax=Paroedura picta TaxID=143630 RepID=UPI00405607F1